MDLSRYKKLFISECRTSISNTYNLIDTLSQGSGGSQDVHELFRHMHSIKGMSATMSYEPLVTLAHAMEAACDPYRRNDKIPTKPFLRLLIEAMAIVERTVDAIEQQGTCPTLYNKETLDALQKHAINAERQWTVTPLPDIGPAEDAPLVEDGWILTIRLSETCKAPSLRAFLILRAFIALDAGCVSVPPEEDLRKNKLTTDSFIIRIPGKVAEQEIQRVIANMPDVKESSLDRRGRTTPKSSDRPVSRPETPRAIEPPSPPRPEGEARQVLPREMRVDAERLDHILEMVSALMIYKSRLETILGEEASNEARQELDSIHRELQNLYDGVLVIRLVSMGALTERLPSVASDLARKLHKQVNLEVRGESIEVDRSVVEMLAAPIMHLLRNAIDHGIESPEERKAAGKPSTGTIRFEAQRVDGNLVLRIDDDGRGLDTRAIVERAIQKGVINAQQAAVLTEQQAFDLICHPGLSTRSEVTTISGRGVGMDVVKATAERLRGRLSIHSKHGKGTVITIEIPTTVAIVPALLVEVGAQQIAATISRIVTTWQTPASEMQDRAFVDIVPLGVVIPRLSLASMLGLPEPAPNGTDIHSFIVVDGPGGQVAIEVDRLIRQIDLVAKPPDEILRRIPGMSGSAILGSGEPVMIFDLFRLLEYGAAAPVN
ncbi:MAG: Chemotaxis protein CheA [Myxococcota bacterium]|nr:Chemotaxis protein CheA [Myxococcota bacterium]